MSNTSDYYKWVTLEAKKINSDGCSHVLDIHKICCYEHDLGYYYGRDPADAYSEGWDKAAKIQRAEVDRRFRACNQAQDPLGKDSPMAWWRWLGVRIGGWKPWNEHRKLRP